MSHIINDGSNLIIDTLYAEYQSTLSDLKEHEIIFITNVLNGLLVDHDSISLDRNEKLMEIFEGIGNSPKYSIPRYSNDLKIVVDAINRFGARIMVQIKKFFRSTNFEHSETLNGVDRDYKIEADLIALEAYYKKFRTLLQTFLYNMSERLSPSEAKFIYTSFNFDFSVEIGYATDFQNTDRNIQSNDVFWT